MRGAATFAIVKSRFRTLWPVTLLLIVLSAAFGWFQQNSLSQFANQSTISLDEPTAWLFGPLLYTTALAIALAYANTRRSSNDIFAFCEESAPLFGRQRARASALVPCIIVFACCIAEYVGARLNPNYITPPTFFAFDAVGAIAAMLVALSIPLRTKWNRALYVFLAFGAAIVCGIIVVAAVAYTNDWIEVFMGNTYFSEFNDVWGAVAEAAFATLIGFIALRQYGEALARYDPLPES